MERARNEQERPRIKVRAALGKPFYKHCPELHGANSDGPLLQFGSRSLKQFQKTILGRTPRLYFMSPPAFLRTCYGCCLSLYSRQPSLNQRGSPKSGCSITDSRMYSGRCRSTARPTTGKRFRGSESWGPCQVDHARQESGYLQAIFARNHDGL